MLGTNRTYNITNKWYVSHEHASARHAFVIPLLSSSKILILQIWICDTNIYYSQFKSKKMKLSRVWKTASWVSNMPGRTWGPAVITSSFKSGHHSVYDTADEYKKSNMGCWDTGWGFVLFYSFRNQWSISGFLRWLKDCHQVWRGNWISPHRRGGGGTTKQEWYQLTTAFSALSPNLSLRFWVSSGFLKIWYVPPRSCCC